MALIEQTIAGSLVVDRLIQKSQDLSIAPQIIRLRYPAH